MGVGRLRKRDFSDNLIDYLKLMLNGVPLGPGKTFFLIDSTSNYYTRLRDMGVATNVIVSSLSEGEALMTSDQGDNLLVLPGTYTSTASLTWDIADSRIIGVGSPNQAYQPSTMTGGGVKLKCTTSAVSQILDVTGNYVQLYNIGTQNTADSAGNVCDVRVRARNFYSQDCSFRGGTGATQIGTANCGLGVFVDESVGTNTDAGNAMWLNRCVLGSSGNTIRTVGAGCFAVYNPSPYTYGGGFGMQFTDCRFSMYSATAGVYACNVDGVFAFDREMYFKNCLFFNFCTPTTNCNYVFNFSTTSSSTAWVVLDKCAAFGFDYWALAASHLYVNNGAANIGPGGISAVVANS